MSERGEPMNVCFRLVVLAAGVFVVTILALVATIFGNPQAPITRFFDAYGGMLIGVEVVLTLFFGGAAMMVDRRRQLRARREAEQAGLVEVAGDLPVATVDARANE